MNEPVGEIDDRVQQLLRAMYERPKPSPEFRQRLYQQLVRELQTRQRSAGWPMRVRALLAGLAATGLLWWRRRPAISAIVAVALLVLVMGTVVLAMQGGLDRIFQPETVPQKQVPAVVRTPTPQPLASPTPTAEQPQREQPPTLAATPAEPEEPAVIPTLTLAPTAVPTATQSPTPTSTTVPTATATPTATPIPPSVEATRSPTPTRVEPTNTVPPSAPTACQAGRITGLAWVDANGSGGRDSGDPPLAGVVVVLEGANGTTTRTTGANGQYAFDNLPAGTYTLRATPPSGYEAITMQAWGVHLTCATITVDFGYKPE